MAPNECRNKSISGQTDQTNWNEENELLTKIIKRDKDVQQRERKQSLGSPHPAKKKRQVKRNEEGAHSGPLGIYPCLEAQWRQGRNKKRHTMLSVLVTSSTARGGSGNFKMYIYDPEKHLPIESFVTTASHLPVSHLIEPFVWWLEQSWYLFVAARNCMGQQVLDDAESLPSCGCTVLPRTTKVREVLASTTKNYSSTAPHYKTFLRDTKFHSVLNWMSMSRAGQKLMTVFTNIPRSTHSPTRLQMQTTSTPWFYQASWKNLKLFTEKEQTLQNTMVVRPLKMQLDTYHQARYQKQQQVWRETCLHVRYQKQEGEREHLLKKEIKDRSWRRRSRNANRYEVHKTSQW